MLVAVSNTTFIFAATNLLVILPLLKLLSSRPSQTDGSSRYKAIFLRSPRSFLLLPINFAVIEVIFIQV